MKLVIKTDGATVEIVYQYTMLYSIVFRDLAYRSVPFVCFFRE